MRTATLILGVTLALLATPGAGAATDRLPDLGMARLGDVRSDKTPDGHRLLRYTTLIVNVGAGLVAGRYRLAVGADASNWFLESNDDNNSTWADIQLRPNGNAVRVVGPAA